MIEIREITDLLDRSTQHYKIKSAVVWIKLIEQRICFFINQQHWLQNVLKFKLSK